MARTPVQAPTSVHVPSATVDVAVLGIDPSLTNTALCLMVNGKLERETLVPTRPTMLRPARFRDVRTTVMDWVTKLPPARHAVVAVEAELWSGQSSDSAAIQALLEVSLWELSSLLSFRYLVVNAAQVKKYAGAPKKEHLLQQVYKRWHREYRSNDAADAFVVAAIATDLVHYSAQSSAVAQVRATSLWPEATKPQVEVLDKLALTGFPWEPQTTVNRKAEREAKRAAKEAKRLAREARAQEQAAKRAARPGRARSLQ